MSSDPYRPTLPPVSGDRPPGTVFLPPPPPTPVGVDLPPPQLPPPISPAPVDVAFAQSSRLSSFPLYHTGPPPPASVLALQPVRRLGHPMESNHPRDKGFVCANFKSRGACTVANCPYKHICGTTSKDVPVHFCRFFAESRCLRESCSFFHGHPDHLTALREAGQHQYRPADFMPSRDPMANLSALELSLTAMHYCVAEQSARQPRDIGTAVVSELYYGVPAGYSGGAVPVLPTGYFADPSVLPLQPGFPMFAPPESPAALFYVSPEYATDQQPRHHYLMHPPRNV